MVKEPFVSRDARGRGALGGGPEELQRGEGALRSRGARDVAALHADRVSGERETDRGDARERPGGGAVRGEAVRRVGQVPEVVERALLERVQKAHRLRRVWGRRAGGVVRGTGGEEGRGERGGAIGHAGRISRAPRAGHRCWRTGDPVARATGAGAPVARGG